MTPSNRILDIAAARAMAANDGQGDVTFKIEIADVLTYLDEQYMLNRGAGFGFGGGGNAFAPTDATDITERIRHIDELSVKYPEAANMFAEERAFWVGRLPKGMGSKP